MLWNWSKQIINFRCFNPKVKEPQHEKWGFCWSILTESIAKGVCEWQTWKSGETGIASIKLVTIRKQGFRVDLMQSVTFEKRQIVWTKLWQSGLKSLLFFQSVLTNWSNLPKRWSCSKPFFFFALVSSFPGMFNLPEFMPGSTKPLRLISYPTDVYKMV